MIRTLNVVGAPLASLLLAASLLLQPAMTPAAQAAQPLSAQAAAQALPKPQEFRLANGLQVYLIERHDLPLLQVQLVFPAGRLYEPAAKPGLADVTAALVTKGTRKRTAVQLADAIDFVGGSLSAVSGADMATVGLAVLSKDMATGLELLSEVVTEPAFSEAELAREKQQAMARLRSSLDDADAVLGMAFDRAVYGKHPYGRNALGSENALAALTREDVVAYHRERYRPDGAFAVIVGDVTRAEVESRFGSALSAWTGKVSPLPEPPPPVPVKGKQVTLVDMDVNQSYVMLGNVSFRRDDPEYYATALMLSILGGGMNSRLFSEVRDRQGLAYGVWAANRLERMSGSVLVGLQTKNASTKQALSSIQYEIARMAKDGVTAKELADAKSSMLGYFPMQLESNSDLARMITRIAFYGLGDDYLSRFHERVQAVDRESIRRAAQKYLPSGDYALVVVGPAKQLEGDLRAFGPVRRIDKRSLIAN